MIYLDEYVAADETRFRPEPNIVEVGCFEPAKRFPLRRIHRAKLHFVEASPENYATLVSRIPAELSGVVALNATLSDHNGALDLFLYEHEQLHTVFPRHVQEQLGLRGIVRVRGYKLWNLLDALEIQTCDLLLLNCEGAEIFAMRQLAESPGLRARVTQFCTSNHCEHIRCYPKSCWDQLMLDLTPHYEATRLKFPSIPYYLFTRKP